MRLRTLAAALALAAACSTVGAAAPARADRYDSYSDSRYHEGRDRAEARRRGILEDRLNGLSDRTRLAERQGELSRRTAEHVYRDLDRVRDFVRGDHYLSESEFGRRMED